MNRKLLFGLVAASLIPASVALACGSDCGCHHDEAASATHEAFKRVTVAQVAALQKAKQAHLFDANTPEFRAKNGTIAGATLLSSSSGYDLSVLPASKGSKLVFFCANTKCLASHAAAKRAVAAGYTDVSVLPDGLLGWRAAGEPVVNAPKS